MENNELEQVTEVAEVVESNGVNNIVKIGIGVGVVAAIAGLGFVVYKKIKARKMQTVDTVEYSEVEPNEGETEE